jgi:heat shock protein HslJ/uncharacterized membrane protein
MNKRTVAALTSVLLAMAGCGKPESPPPPAPESSQETAAAPAQGPASFVNRVWVVAESQAVAAGDTRVFLADGTLVMTSPNATPAFGSWRYANGRLTIVEEGQEYPTEVLELTDHRFRVRMQGPGQSIEILFEPGPQRLPEAVASREPAAAPQPAPAAAAVALLGTAWKLDRLDGMPVQRGTEPTLEFPAEGRASGNGSCNRFNGIVSIQDGAIMFGGIATTRKACREAVMRQEEAYLSALRESVRFEADAESLILHSAGREEPLRFVPAPAPAAPSAQGMRTAPGGVPSTLTGLWTIVGHHLPGVSAMTGEEAGRRHGETIRLLDHGAVSASDRCAEPRYSTRQAPAAGYLAEQFRLAPGSLAPLAARNQVRIQETSCDGSPWPALGATLIEVDRDRALAPWDGVFFELARDRDFRAVGHEPAWQLEIRKGSEMRFTYDDGKGTAVTPSPRSQPDARTGTRTLNARTESSDLRVEIVPVSCIDAASGRPFMSTVTVTLSGRAFRGCGETLATPFQ